MHKRIRPLLIRSLLYSIIAAPLIAFSIVSVYYVLFRLEGTNDILLPVIVFSAAGALGFALFREALHKNKEIKKESQVHIIERIRSSEFLDLHFKEKYVKHIEKSPKDMFKVFVVFIEHEQSIRRSKEED
ncbi:MAG: DUF5392 family protein [Bacillus sp. (in: Bacteria)]|nr:DUF5392 family protein [Bacillus sp. (in: firmicutes)]